MESGLWERAMEMQAAGRADEAIAMVRLRRKLHPRDPQLMNLLGVLLWATGGLEESERLLSGAVAARPGDADFLHNLGSTLAHRGRLQEAVSVLRRAAECDPASPLAWVTLSTTLPRLQCAGEAVEAGMRAVRLDPASPAAHAGLAHALKGAGRIPEAIDAARRTIDALPSDPRVRSPLLLLLNSVDGDPAATLAEHRAFGTACRPWRAPAEPREPEPSRPLTVGFLSGDLRDHSVAFFLEPLLEHVPEGWRTVAFSTLVPAQGDRVAARMRARFDEWVDAWRLTDEALDAEIRLRGIDVLVELAGHTAGNRLTAIASSPAPVIVSALGYPNTTGLPAVGWRVVDSITDPPGRGWTCTERPLRVDPCFLCYRPPEDAPAPAMPSASAPFTFGSFNHAAKVGDACIRSWARVLAAVPGSCLLLKSGSLEDPAVRESIAARLESAGVARTRVTMLDRTDTRADHLATYGRVHVALDSVPYNGTTTTCEAMWMGVPVPCIAGDRHCARVSASLVTAAGHPEWVAEDDAGMAAIAARLAQDRGALESIRSGLRDDLRRSTLADAAGYAGRFHAALRACWAERCGRS